MTYQILVKNSVLDYVHTAHIDDELAALRIANEQNGAAIFGHSQAHAVVIPIPALRGVFSEKLGPAFAAQRAA